MVLNGLFGKLSTITFILQAQQELLFSQPLDTIKVGKEKKPLLQRVVV